MVARVETLAYSGEAPWHRLGRAVSNEMTTEQMQEAAGLNWSTEKRPIFAPAIGHPDAGIPMQQITGKYALLRNTDSKILTLCGENWNPVQNSEALGFFKEFVEAGTMKMETAGSLCDGEFTFALASIQESFGLKSTHLAGEEDVVKGYLLFSNPFKIGHSINIQFTPIRVVCMNTLVMALRTKTAGTGAFRMRHTAKFEPEVAKEALGIAKHQLQEFKEEAAFLTSRLVNKADLKEFFIEALGLPERKPGDKGIDRVGEAMEYFYLQPGEQLHPDSWWNAFNTITFMADHLLGRNDNNRLKNSWFGHMQRKKQLALNLALKKATLSKAA